MIVEFTFNQMDRWSIVGCKRFYLFISLMAFLGCEKAFSQERQGYESDSLGVNMGRFRVLEIRGQSGQHIYSGESLKEATSSGYAALEVRYAWQPKFPEKWYRYYGYPSYGIGYYSGFLGDPQLFGNPNAFFGFVNFPLSRPGKRNAFELSPGLGVTYNLNPYNPEHNPLNDAIGSKINVYFNLNAGFVYQFNREIDLTYGVTFSHFSNGRTNIPNHGLNMFGAYIGLRYHYNADQHLLDKDPYTNQLMQARLKTPARTRMGRMNEQRILIYAAMGSVEAWDDVVGGSTSRYHTRSVTLDYLYQWRIMHALTLGMDYFYDPSMEVNFPGSPEKYTMLGIHGGYRFSFWKLGILLQAGTYINNQGRKRDLFVRPAFQYHISNRFYAQVGLKTRGPGAADWIEWGIGYAPFVWRK